MLIQKGLCKLGIELCDIYRHPSDTRMVALLVEIVRFYVFLLVLIKGNKVTPSCRFLRKFKRDKPTAFSTVEDCMPKALIIPTLTE